MFTTIINIQDRLINGQMGTVIKLVLTPITNQMFYMLNLTMKKAGKTTINTRSNSFAKENRLVPIE